MSYSRLYRDIADGYQIPYREAAKMTLHQIWASCVDKKRFLPDRVDPKGATISMPIDEAIASGLVKIPGKTAEQAAADQKEAQSDFDRQVQMMAESALLGTENVRRAQQQTETGEQAARRRKRERMQGRRK